MANKVAVLRAKDNADLSVLFCFVYVLYVSDHDTLVNLIAQRIIFDDVAQRRSSVAIAVRHCAVDGRAAGVLKMPVPALKVPCAGIDDDCLVVNPPSLR